MFTSDRRLLQRVAQGVPRALVLDPQAASAKLVADLLKEMGVRQVLTYNRTSLGLEAIANVDPMLICMEAAGPDGFDGLELVRKLRRSQIAARKVPVILITGEATVESIKMARDAGVHEFLRKPFTAKDLFRRVENVVLKPRLWIDAQMYVGPDRRRFNSGEFTGAKKRRADAAYSAEMMLAQEAAAVAAEAAA
jgi:DNA-binding response OmpR family regulator